METFFTICAAFGGTLMLCQLVALLMGVGGDHGEAGGGYDGSHDIGHDVGHDIGHDVGHDVGGDHGHAVGHHGEPSSGGSSWFFGVLSFRALTAALTFYGLGGLAAHYAELKPGLSLAIGLVCGAVALYVVVLLMRLLAGLRADGTVRLSRAVGGPGTVYVRVPANKSGAGKVTLVLQSRTVEVAAVTPANQPLPTGSKVKVVALLDPHTVEVIPESTPAETTTHA